MKMVWNFGLNLLVRTHSVKLKRWNKIDKTQGRKENAAFTGTMAGSLKAGI